MSRELKYRPEIDGLRTIAILGVIIFHLKPDLLKGGFLGVDVFFVISGFLITTIIYKQIREQRFSFWAFWKRRFKRLYPALAITVAVTLVIGTLILPYPERGALPLQAIGALFSFSNILLWKTTGGYWDSASENISLLHTWSLSVEEQFYVCIPIFLFLCYSRFKSHVKKLFFALFFLSLISCVVFTDIRQSATFYLLPTRMWELLLGGLFAIYKPNLNAVFRTTYSVTAIHLIAISLILASYLLIEDGENFPGFYPLFPCIGTFLLLSLRDHRSIVTRLLSTNFFVYIGKLSYSLYLWHWPIIVYANYFTPSPDIIGLLLVTFGVSALSYHFIEQPLRSHVKHPLVCLAVGASTVAICFLGLFAFPRAPMLKELGNFDDPIALTRGWEYEATEKILDMDFSPIASSPSPKIVVVGSSHARVICKPIDMFAQANGYDFISLATSSIAITTSAPLPQRPDALEINNRRFELVKEIKPDIIIVAGKWTSEFSTGEDMTLVVKNKLEELASFTDRMFVLGQVPLVDLPQTHKDTMRRFIVSLSLRGEPIRLNPSPKVFKANEILKAAIAMLNTEKIVYIDPTDLLITKDGYVRVFEDEAFLYSDYHHLNDFGATVLFKALLYPRLIENKPIQTKSNKAVQATSLRAAPDL